MSGVHRKTWRSLSLLAFVFSCGTAPSITQQTTEKAASPKTPPAPVTTPSMKAEATPPSAAPAFETPPAAAEAVQVFKTEEVFSILIRGGEVIDGTGSKRKKADVVVLDDKIVFVGEVDASVKANHIIDASHAIVTPGFFDTHAHGSPLGNVEYALAQGITTLVVGQDGLSPATNLKAWLSKVDAEKPRVNVATLVGHATLREIAALHISRNPRPEALVKLKKLVEKALDDGAFGASTGLEYDAGKGATMPELIALSEPVGARGGVVMSHLRSEDDDRIEEALDELLVSCQKGGARAHIAHFKIVLGRGETRASALLAKIEQARKTGLEISADLYPYAASYTGISILFPDFARPPASYAEATRSRRAELLAALRAKVIKRNGPEATIFGTGEYAGKTLLEASRSVNLPFEEILFNLGPNGAEAAYFVMDDAVVTRLFLDPFVMIGTDGGGGGRHPRGYGAFARVLEDLVQKRNLVSLEEAIRKMTTLPAKTLGLEGKRGCLQKGCFADILVFDPEEIHERASFVSPHRLASGMRHVIVGGIIERENEKPTKGRGGRALRFEGRATKK